MSVTRCALLFHDSKTFVSHFGLSASRKILWFGITIVVIYTNYTYINFFAAGTRSWTSRSCPMVLTVTWRSVRGTMVRWRWTLDRWCLTTTTPCRQCPSAPTPAHRGKPRWVSPVCQGMTRCVAPIYRVKTRCVASCLQEEDKVRSLCLYRGKTGCVAHVCQGKTRCVDSCLPGEYKVRIYSILSTVRSQGALCLPMEDNICCLTVCKGRPYWISQSAIA